MKLMWECELCARPANFRCREIDKWVCSHVCQDVLKRRKVRIMQPEQVQLSLSLVLSDGKMIQS